VYRERAWGQSSLGVERELVLTCLQCGWYQQPPPLGLLGRWWSGKRPAFAEPLPPEEPGDGKG